jgi:Uma2 family endonuclease
MADAARKGITVDEFLRWDDGTDRRYELVDGEIVAMAPPSEAHGVIVSSIVRLIGNALRPPCRVVTEAGIRLADRDDRYYQADVAVTCAPPSKAQPVAEPVLIVEVLSPSTAEHDRGRKLPDYQEIASVQEILVVSSMRRSVQHWRRSGKAWVVTTIDREIVELSSVGVALPVAEIYAGTVL